GNNLLPGVSKDSGVSVSNNVLGQRHRIQAKILFQFQITPIRTRFGARCELCCCARVRVWLRYRTQLPVPRSLRRHKGLVSNALGLPDAFIVCEEKCAVLYDRPADRAPEL